MKRCLHLLPLLLLFLLPLAGQADDHIHFGWDIVVAAEETLGDAVCFACSIRVEGTASGDAVAIAGNVTVAGTVGADVVAVGGDVRLLSGASAGGEVVSVGGRVVLDPNATLKSGVEKAPYLHFPGQRAFYWRGMLVLILVNLAVVLLGGLILRPRRLENMAGALRRHYLLTPMLGLVLLLGVSSSYSLAGLLGQWEDWGNNILTIVLLGVPLAGYLGIAQLVGTLGARSRHPWGVLVTGAAGTTLLLLLPLIGFLLLLAVFVLGFGIVAVSGLGGSPDWLPARFARRRHATAA
ncbi:MAG: hypothetical protein ACE5IP_06880 [Terriglobia bacterium]